MRSLNVLLIILSVVANAKSVGTRDNGFERKRFDLGLETCMENFDVHVDKIIRTQDSRAMGAKYLNEAEVAGRDECMKLCCETPLCDVFVFEQKVPGSCYLFHCGSPEDFKCKFTQHRNYTSAVLAFNSRLGDLENRMKLTKHEEELAMLRKLYPSIDSTTTLSPMSTKVPAVLPETDKQNHSSKSQCSRYQFECRASGECIAIYNACDGIPQCSDGSDEAPELDCPTISGLSHPKTFHDQLKSLKTTNESPMQVVKDVEHSTTPEPTPVAKQQQAVAKPQSVVGQQSPSSPFKYFPFGYSQQNEQQSSEPSRPKVEPVQQMGNQLRYYGREGEMVQYPMNNGQWQGYQPRRQEDNSYLFNHKATGLGPENSDGQYPVPYSNDMSRTDYLKYAGTSGNGGYYSGSGPVYYPGPNGWVQRIPQAPHGVEMDVPQRPLLSMYGNGMSGSMPSDYYYEDSQLKARYPVGPQEFQRIHNSADMVATNQKNLKDQDKPDGKEQVTSKKTESVKKTLENQTPPSAAAGEKVEATTSTTVTTTTTTAASAVAAAAAPAITTSVKKESPTSSHEVSRVAEHLRMTEADMKDVDGVNERPSGAILSLTLGMCITAIMITLVGCRLRVVRKRMRRNGKSSYAHDADFLVNGMYL